MDINKMTERFMKEGFQVSYFETGAEAVSHISSQLCEKTIGFGGSKTVEKLGLFEKLGEKNTVYWHWKQPVEEARKNSLNAEIYICSANGVSESGEIVNLGSDGNRLSSMLYGKKKVFFVIGVNKIVPQLEQAIWRARNIAAPMNAKRLNKKTPCVLGKEMKCYDCMSPERICRGMSIIMRKPKGVDECELVIINEDLGY